MLCYHLIDMTMTIRTDRESLRGSSSPQYPSFVLYGGNLTKVRQKYDMPELEHMFSFDNWFLLVYTNIVR